MAKNLDEGRGAAKDRRDRAERRGRHVLFTDWRWAHRGRRRLSRRAAEAAELGVDQYGPALGVAALAIFLLSCLDAALTLALVRGGVAYEANPLMDALIRHDAQIFVNLKLVFTGAGVLFLVSLAESRLLRRIPVRVIILGLLSVYFGIVFYQIAHVGLLA